VEILFKSSFDFVFFAKDSFPNTVIELSQSVGLRFGTIFSIDNFRSYRIRCQLGLFSIGSDKVIEGTGSQDYLSFV
jgi:hypothetical protein